MISFSMVGFDKADRTLADWQDQFSRPNDILEYLGEREVDRTKNRLYHTKMSPNGMPWTPWDMDTREQREKRGTVSGGLLYETGSLYDSIDMQVVGNQVHIGSDKEYAGYLQNGTLEMEARPFLGFNVESEQDLSFVLNKILLNIDK